MDGIVGFIHRAEQAKRDRSEMAARPIELLGKAVLLRHRSPSVFVGRHRGANQDAKRTEMTMQVLSSYGTNCIVEQSVFVKLSNPES